MLREILHCDMNNFYASVECMLNPSLRGYPIAVGGDVENRHGIILAKNEIAKACGVKTAQPIYMAQKLCPDLMIVPPHFDAYVYYSRCAHAIYQSVTDLIEPFGMDESWLDVTGSSLLGSPRDIADRLRSKIRRELGLSISVGVSFNKIFAKLGSDLKKPDATTEIRYENFQESIWNLPASLLLGVGDSTAKLLATHRIRTIGELACAPEKWLYTLLGKMGPVLKRYAAGEENSAVVPKDYESPLKSIGHGVTTREDLTEQGEVRDLIILLSQDVGTRLRRYEMLAGSIAVDIRDTTLRRQSFQVQLPYQSNNSRLLAAEAYSLFQRSYQWEAAIRSVSVRAFSLLSKKEQKPVDFLSGYMADHRACTLDKTVDSIRHRFGESALLPAAMLHNGKFPTDRSFEITLPNERL